MTNFILQHLQYLMPLSHTQYFLTKANNENYRSWVYLVTPVAMPALHNPALGSSFLPGKVLLWQMGFHLLLVSRRSENRRNFGGNWALARMSTGKRAKEPFLLTGALEAHLKQRTYLCMWLSGQCVPSSLWIRSCSSHDQRLGKTKWPMGLIFAQPRPQQLTVLQLVRDEVILTDTLWKKFKPVSMRLLLLHCIFLESQPRNHTQCLTYIQQCLKKNAVLKKMKIFCLRKFSANLAYSVIFSYCHLIRSTSLQTKM